VTPNVITAFFVLIAAVGSIMILSDKWYIYYTGLIMQPMAIVFDCVDGEIARVKYAYSKSGEWLDTVGDNFCTLFFVIAIAIKNHGIHNNDASLILGTVSVSIYVLAVLMLFMTLYKTTSSGSLQALSKEVQKSGALAKFVTVALKRNLVTLYFMILGFFYLTQTLLILNIAGGLGLMSYSVISLIKSGKGKG
jgi:phosphatidylglycerophosphate synthase